MSRVIVDPSDNSWSTCVSATLERGPSIPTSHICEPLPVNSTGTSIVDDSTVGMLLPNVDSTECYQGFRTRVLYQNQFLVHEIVPLINPITPRVPREANLISLSSTVIYLPLLVRLYSMPHTLLSEYCHLEEN